jgi:hypothetical protein
MMLNDSQKKQVAQWMEAGLKLSEIQNRLAAEMGLQMTYMEVRFLVDDLKLTPKDPDPPAADEPAPGVPKADEAGDAKAAAPEPADGSTPDPGVSVTVDALTKPGSMVSGKVTFSDGNTADWYVDQMGRLGLVPKTEGYRPSAADVQEFQIALEREISRAGL